jgi:hypothetical protein
MWDSKLIAENIAIKEVKENLEPEFIHLRLFDIEKSIGIGVDGRGNTVLMLPGQTEVPAFQTAFASYDPWAQLTVFETGKQLQGISVLRCDLDLDDIDNVEAAAAIFLGLLDLQEKFGKTGKAIWQLKSLFENRLKFKLSDEAITGLMGELLLILVSTNPSIAINYWHSNLDDKFDFSGEKFRLEVKSTTSGIRNHNFSSFQIPGNVPEKIFVASTQIVRIESGTTLSGVLQRIEQRVDVQSFQKVINNVNETLGVPHELLVDYQIDLEPSIDSIRIYRGLDVPCPTAPHGVISMKWLASLDGISPLDSIYEDFFIQITLK